MQYYYNVCLNRILDATKQANFECLAHYEGYIIPTDRSPCFDDNWQKVDYVCYDHPIGHEHVPQLNINMTFSVDGDYCYDFKDPKTVIWYQNKPLLTEDFMWLFGLWARWFMLAIPFYSRHWGKRRK